MFRTTTITFNYHHKMINHFHFNDDDDVVDNDKSLLLFKEKIQFTKSVIRKFDFASIFVLIGSLDHHGSCDCYHHHI
ncbi:hypothetical protein DERP_007056 [Dermatophagoides pteronyssinus]|uniref:Uncharacterized protein n=1 Tax=Dermatophagoides pteronyssinus TaxID=6956 RepID=A0ABQ8JUY1_DERPT|nr:hypothetical protein DERP_007056 [Dermatophagoides pteronyssinus]